MKPSRLAWFPLYADDLLGGVLSFSSAEVGAYCLALLQQWQSKELQAIPDDFHRLSVICREPMPDVVRAKFSQVVINGTNYLRNERLAKEWYKAKAEHEARSRGGKHTAEQRAEHPTEQPADRGASRGRVPTTTTTSAKADSPNGAAERPVTFWDTATRELERCGVPEQQARSFLGRLVKDHGEENVAQAVATLSLKPIPAADPRAYLKGMLKPKPRMNLA